MADENHQEKMDQRKSETDGDQKPKDCLENFVTELYKKQKEEGKMNSTDELGEDRANDFFTRALAESRRMNTEVEKSNQKLAKLHGEFGLDMVDAWHTEHASEVLSPQQQDLVKQSQYRAPPESTAQGAV